MKPTVTRSTRLVAAAVAGLVGMALVAPPCLAAEPRAAATAPSLRAAVVSMATSDARTVERLSQGTTESAPAGETRSFIHSPKGVAAILLLAGGITWAVISRKNDAVHSPGRK